MPDDEWVDLSDAPLIADVHWLHEQRNGDHPARSTLELRIVTLGEFISVEEETAEPLLGTSTETLLPADGMLLMYGDGGAGKTTLTVDMAVHLGSGCSWLGINVPRPVRITLIENEGPRGKFRQMLAEKAEWWRGESFQENVHVLEEPWTRFTLQDDTHRQGLVEHITASDTDLVVMGPLATLGMVGGGTPDEISAFELLLGKTRALLERPVSFWIVHHENKSGDVSGAWERVPDTLVHVQARGNGHTALHWRKARWASEWHGTSVDLTWEEGRSFDVVEDKERDPYTEMLAAFVHADAWRTVKESAKLIAISEGDARKVLAELVRRGEMVYEKGPSGRHGSAHCWRLKGALEPLAHLSAPSSIPPSEGALEHHPPSLREGGAQRRLAESVERSAGDVSAPDDGIPF